MSVPELLVLTFKVNVSICVYVQLLQDLLQFAFLQFLPQHRLDRLLQLLLVDLSISIEIELETEKVLALLFCCNEVTLVMNCSSSLDSPE